MKSLTVYLTSNGYVPVFELTLIRLGFLKVVFPSYFKKNLSNFNKTSYNYETIYLKYVEGEKNAYIICYKLTSLVSLQQGNVKKSEKLIKVDENS